MPELVWLLLPLAAFGGWYAARWNRRDAEDRQSDFPGPEYLKGLDYLLNEQPDKAIDVFVSVLEVGADTYDTHLVLGNLFRNRGESDRAIRIHHNLATKESLSRKQRSEARLELARDFQSAGLFDRAEEHYTALLSERSHVDAVLPRLLDVYQQERDWERAFDTAGRMDEIGDRPAATVRAQFLCEMAEVAREGGETDGARTLLARALDLDASCVRASLLLGNFEREAGRYEAALTAYSRAGRQDPDLLPEVLGGMYACHRELDDTQGMIGYLRNCIPLCDDIAPVILLAEILAGQHRLDEACEAVSEALVRFPSLHGLAKYLELRLAGCGTNDREGLLMVKDVVDHLQNGRPAYLCRECGFTGKSLHWQCPGCRAWDTVRPVRCTDGG
jgi:lipopolysaccharide biosynthesis regulator YciM